MIVLNSIWRGAVFSVVSILIVWPSWGQLADTDARISLELSGESVEDAMRILSDATGLNILVSSGVQGTITAYVVEMDPERALREMVEINGYHYVRNDDVVWVLSDEEYFEDFNLGRERRVLRLEYARATDLSGLMAELAGPNSEVLTYVAANVFVVAAVPERLQALESVIQELDRPEETQVFQLEHAAAPTMLEFLRSHVGESGRMYADIRTNRISVTGSSKQLESVGALLREFDRPDMVVTKTIRLRFAKADVVADLLRQVLTGRSSAASAAQASAAPQSTQSSESATPSTASPAAGLSARTSLGARGSGQTGVVRQTPVSSVTPEAAVSPPTQTRAENTTSSEDGDAMGLGPLANVTADTRTNSIILTHTEAVVARLETIVKEIDVPNEFHVYQFLNVNPADVDVEGKLSMLFASEDSFLNVDPLTRTVTFRCGPERAEEIYALLDTWDSTIRQVRIDAEILSVNVSVVQESGISWQVILDNQADSFSALFPPGLASTSPQGILSAGTLADNDYTAALQALATDSDTQSIASPRILVRDGGEALFSSARDEPFTVVTVDGNTDTTLQDVRFLNVGVNLSVTPTINREDLVAMDVLLEISDLVEVRNDIPVVDRSTAQSSINVRSGGTAILGGLRQSSRSMQSSGVPVLRKIPILGFFFRNKRNDDAEFEILLVLRPLIVDSPADEPRSLEEISSDLNSLLDEDSPDYKAFTKE